MLGPESDGDAQAPSVQELTSGPIAAQGGKDEEKNIQSNGRRTAAVSGPGLGDLHTAGNRDAVRRVFPSIKVMTDRPHQVFDLEKQPGPYAANLERIETLLNQLLADKNSNSPHSHGSNITVGEPTHIHTHTKTLSSDQGRPSTKRRTSSTRTGVSRVTTAPPIPAGAAVPHQHQHGGNGAHPLLEDLHGVAGAGGRGHADIPQRR